jgi:hypothetical protein
MESRENPKAPSQDAGGLTRSDAKSNDHARLARALRENLQRRKTQKRERLAPDGEAGGSNGRRETRP